MCKILEAQEELCMWKVKEQIQNSESKISRLCDLIWTSRIQKNCDSQKLININENQESTSLSRIDELLLKVCIQLFKIVKSLTQLMQKTERWHWIRNKKAFHALKKSLSETAHLVISQSACKKILKIDTSILQLMHVYIRLNEVRRFIVFQSRKLSEFKKRYEIHDKELLVIVKALQEWKSYFRS
jgi:hypothetical protein